jgi:hypothetical protein
MITPDAKGGGRALPAGIIIRDSQHLSMSASTVSVASARESVSPRTSRPEAESVMAQLQRIVESPAFCNSKRYPRFLRFIVEQTLQGHADLLKERLLAFEVFDRSTDYDPSIDPIVRVAASEIRKRLAQYYVEHGHENEVRITLEPGSYVPEFHLPTPAVLENVYDNAASLKTRSKLFHELVTRRNIGILAAALVIAIASSIIWWGHIANPVKVFWKPFLEAGSSPLICIGDADYLDADATKLPQNHDHIPLGDVEAMNRISSALAHVGKPVILSDAHSTSYAQLCKQPVILVGGGPNPWTMREMQYLPYQLVRNFQPHINGILNKNDRSKLLWSVDFGQAVETQPRQYAIVARFRNPDSGQLVLIAAGVGAVGQVAAGDFLTNPDYLRDFIRHAPRGWQDQNLEIILETQMINGASGPPHVIATYLW